MTFEIAISTMHKTKEQCLEMLKQENIHCNCIVINQCDADEYHEEIINNQLIRLFFTKERGLSKSRNMALRNMHADIMAIGDDDILYYEGFNDIILKYYETNKNADVVLFNLEDCYKIYPNRNKKCCFLELTGYKSMQITFTKKMSSINFNEYFGTGSNHVQSGEENIFLADCWRKGANIYYCKEKILKRELKESSWFKGYTERFFKDRGAVYYAISHFYFFLYILRYAIKTRGETDCNIFSILYLMLEGKNEYKKYNQYINHEKI